jgi:hypothetical protein
MSKRLGDAVPSVQELVDDPRLLVRTDIATVNMACAIGLPGAENLAIAKCIATLAGWTNSVRRYGLSSMAEFIERPGDFHGHSGFAKFLSMVTLLKHPRGLGVSYQPTAIGNFDFSDSRDDLLHGILTRRLGTCASLPVLYVAIGRRLNWPIHLALAKRHVFCQWRNDDGTTANLEGSCPGGGLYLTDEQTRSEPRFLTAADMATGRYLRPLTRAEEFALFLETRGHCLVDNRRFEEAREAYGQARQVAPAFADYHNHLYSLSLHEDDHANTTADHSRNAPIAPPPVKPSVRFVSGHPAYPASTYIHMTVLRPFR